MSTLKPWGPGDCYEVAAELAVKTPGLTLCHGSALGTGGDAAGIRFGHAWCETEVLGKTFVIDRSNGHDYFGPVARFYAVGTIQNVRRYPRAEAMRLLLSHQHYGPWHNDMEVEDVPSPTRP